MIVKNGTRICGSGGVLCTAPIVQNKCYFEVKVQQSGKYMHTITVNILLLVECWYLFINVLN